MCCTGGYGMDYFFGWGQRSPETLLLSANYMQESLSFFYNGAFLFHLLFLLVIFIALLH